MGRIQFCSGKTGVSGTAEIKVLGNRHMQVIHSLAHVDSAFQRKILVFQQIGKNIAFIIGVFQPAQNLITACRIIQSIQ